MVGKNPPELEFVNGLRGMIENGTLGVISQKHEYKIPATPMTVVVGREQTKIVFADGEIMLASTTSPDHSLRGAHNSLYKLVRGKHGLASVKTGGAISPPR